MRKNTSKGVVVALVIVAIALSLLISKAFATSAYDLTFSCSAGGHGMNDMGGTGLEVDGKQIVKKHCVREFLDENGVFHHDRALGNRYQPQCDDISIFVSKLGAMDSQQTLHFEAIKSIIDGYDNFTLCSIERHQYRPVSQLIDIETKIDKCDGCIIFAFDYLKVDTGVIHQNVVGSDHKVINNMSFASPWLHIETALANGKQKPCLIIYDQDLQRNGMFDELVSRSDRNLLCIPFSDAINKENPELIKWVQRVHEYHQRNRNCLEND